MSSKNDAVQTHINENEGKPQMTIESAAQSGSRLKISKSTRVNVVVEGSLALRRFDAPREWTSNDVDALAFAKSVLRSESEAIMAQESRLDARFC